jgi:hypothetical protein
MYLSCSAEIIEIIFLTVAAVVTKNEKESVMASRVWSTGICFGGSLESGGRFCVGAFRSNLALVDVKIFFQI